MTAGRPPNILRPIKLNTSIPEDLRAKLDIYLFSEVEGRIPHGAYAKFIHGLIKDFFDEELAKAKRVKMEGGESSPVPTLVSPPTDEKPLAALGLLTEIAMTDLRRGFSQDQIIALVRRAREITGKMPSIKETS